MPTCLFPSICKASFGKVTDFREHVRLAHGPGILAKFDQIEWLRFNHGLGHSRFICPACGGEPADCPEHDDFGAVTEEEYAQLSRAEAG